MKKIISLVFSVVLLLSIDVSAFAASNTHNIDELDLSVTIPTGYYVITRDTPANDTVFNDLGITKSAAISQFESSSIYLNAISKTNNEEVVVTMLESSLGDFNSLNDTALSALASTLISQYSNHGFSVLKHDIYQHSQTKFIRLHFKDLANTVYGLQYYTIIDGKAMNFTMRSYEGSISSKQETTIKTIVDSIKYNKSISTSTSESSKNTNSFVYTDSESGVTFTVPANWEQKAFTEDREFIDVKFASTKEDGCIIIYGSVDMWSMMSATEKKGYSRSELNNSAFTKTEIAEMYGLSADKISVVTYNGIQYYKGEFTTSQEVYGINVTVTMTQLIYIDNGWAYTFQFGGTSSHKLYGEFESLLNTVKYTTASNTIVGDSSSSLISSVYSFYDDFNNNNKTNNSDAVIVIAVLVVLTVLVIVFMVIREKKERENNAKYTPIYDVSSLDSLNDKPSTILCKNCGELLPSDSEFCHMCGTRISKGD